MNDPGSMQLVAIGIALGSVLVIALAYFAVGQFASDEQRRFQRRVDRARGKRVEAPRKTESLSARIDTANSSIKLLDEVLKRLVPKPERLRERLAMTGYQITIGQYVMATAATALVCYIALVSLLPLGSVFSALLAIAGGLLLPHLVIGVLVGRRLKKFTVTFPEAIDLIVRGLKSGLPVTESIKIVGTEMPDPIGIEFRRVADSFGLGVTLDQALVAATKRLDTPEFRFFVISLSVQRETGGNLSETLENLANILRRRKQIKLKIRAMSSEARASAYIIGSLPFIMFGLLTWANPDYMLTLIRDPRGEMMLGMAMASLVTGVAIMFRMAKFEI